MQSLPGMPLPSTEGHAAFMSDWVNRGLLEKSIDVVAALTILIVGWWLSRRLVRLLDNVLARARMDAILRSFLRNVVSVLSMIVVVIAALQKFGVPTTSLLALLGAAGLAIGLALKDSLSNIASGVMLITLRPFKAGDSVRAGGMEGIVEQVRIFQTRLRTYQNEVIYLPNSEITTKPIVNITGKPVRRADILVGIDYGDRIDNARRVLLEIAHSNEKVLRKPEPAVLVTGLGDSSVDMELRVWIRTDDFIAVRSDLYEAVHTTFAENGLSIPFPQRDLHVYHRQVADTGDSAFDDSAPGTTP